MECQQESESGDHRGGSLLPFPLSKKKTPKKKEEKKRRKKKEKKG
jgi:hypothetical protein